MTEQEKLIERTEKLLSKLGDKTQNHLFNAIAKYIAENLELDSAGNIKVTQTNRDTIFNVDNILYEIEVEFGKKAAITIIDSVVELLSINENYYSQFEPNKIKYKEIIAQARSTIKERLGVNSQGKPINGGYISTLINNPSLTAEIKRYMYRQIILGNGRYNETIEGVKTFINGAPNTNGIVQSYVTANVIDTFAQVDRSINVEFANRLKLKAFIYSGGLIEASRKFCISKNNKIFTTDEAKEWVNDRDLLLTKAERESGGKPKGYSPLIDMGRWRCRHTVAYISNEMAIRERPELKGILE